MRTSSPRRRVSRTKRTMRLLFLALALGCLLAAPLPGLAQDAPVLRERIAVHGDLVTLGDLFENAGSAANAPVFRSPDLGTSGVVAAKRIVAAAGKHGLVWTNPGGVEQISVERPARRIALEDVGRAVAIHAAHELDVSDPKNLRVTFERRARAFNVSTRITGALIVKRLHLQRANGVFEAVIGFEAAGRKMRDRSFRGRVVETAEVAVPARAIERGATIREGDVRIARLPLTRLRAGIVTETGDLAGMAAKRTLPAGEPVRRSQIEHPKLVRRNALVTILYETPGLSLKAQGRAQADASDGETVAVLNTRSNRTVQAIVRGPGLVAVGTLNPPATAHTAAARTQTPNRRAAYAGTRATR